MNKKEFNQIHSAFRLIKRQGLEQAAWQQIQEAVKKVKGEMNWGELHSLTWDVLTFVERKYFSKNLNLSERLKIFKESNKLKKLEELEKQDLSPERDLINKEIEQLFAMPLVIKEYPVDYSLVDKFKSIKSNVERVRYRFKHFVELENSIKA